MSPSEEVSRIEKTYRTVLAVFTLASAVLAVTTKRILRAATFLLFVLFGTAGIYFQLNYSFLGAVQLLIYAGGITVLYVFSILLTSSEGDKAEKLRGYKFVVGILATLAGLAICLFVTLRHQFLPEHFEHGELAVRAIRIPPTMQASSNKLMTSNGSR